MVDVVYEQDYALTFDADEHPLVSVKKSWMPTMFWVKDALVLYAVPKGELMNGTKTKAMTNFSIDVGVAEKFGLIEQPKGWSGYRLGTNLQFALPSVIYDNKAPPQIHQIDRTRTGMEGILLGFNLKIRQVM